MGQTSVNLTQLTPKAAVLCEKTRNNGPLGGSRSLKVTDFITDRKPVCCFLLVNNINLCHISHCSRIITAYWLKLSFLTGSALV